MPMKTRTAYCLIYKISKMPINTVAAYMVESIKICKMPINTITAYSWVYKNLQDAYEYEN